MCPTTSFIAVGGLRRTILRLDAGGRRRVECTSMRRRRLLNASDDSSTGRLLVHAPPPPPPRAAADSSTGRLLVHAPPPPPPRAADDSSTGRLLVHAPPPPPPRAADSRSPQSSEETRLLLEQMDKEGTSTSTDERDMIQVSINEHYEIESVGRGVVGLHLHGKMAVTFPPNSDLFVQFELMKLGGLKLRPHPVVDKDLLTSWGCVKPKTPERPFDTEHCELLKWHQKEFRTPPPPMIKVTGYPSINLAEQGGVVHNILGITYKYQGPTPLLNLVIKIPIPRVDVTGHPRRLVRTYVWHNIGSNIETEDFVEWHIGSVNESNDRGDFSVDFYYDAGSFDMRQFYPVEASFTYTDCRALTVARVRASDGSLLKFQQTALGNCRYVFDPYLLERRAAERQAELRAWEEQPWDV